MIRTRTSRTIGHGALLALSLSASACIDPEDEDADDDEQLATEWQDIRGTATTTAVGELDAVGSIGGCTATLISKEAVLTAGHCVCEPDGFTTELTCNTTRSFTFDNVLPVGSTVRQDVTIPADVIVHPDYNRVSWLGNDYAILRLRTPADQVVRVTPMRAASALPSIGQTHTMVGYGGFGPSCASGGDGTKRRGSSVLDGVTSFASPGGKTLVYNDTNIGSCPGDSGGPVINASGQVVGVASSADFNTNSNYDPTSEAWAFLQANACPHFDRAFPDTAFCNDPMCPCARAEGDCDTSSQCKSGSVCVNNIGAAVGFSSSNDLCWSASDLVTFYRDPSYAGVAQALPVGTWDVTDLTGVGNDLISSLKAKPGLSVQLYAEAGCWGSSRLVSGDAASLGTLDNRTSCVQIEPGVTLYRSPSYAGIQQTFRAGSFSAAALTTLGNDQAESMIASPGVVVRLCSESGGASGVGWGTCSNFSGSVSTLGTLNNSVSNVEVLYGVTVYRNEDYTGTSQTFPQGSWGSASLTTVGNDQISSLIVAPGMQATLCKENGGWGGCETYTGSVSFVGKLLDNQASNIVVSPIP